MVKDRGKEPGPDPNTDGRLEKPGLKILHVQDVDFRTHAPTFIEALKQVRAWSKAHPRHVPILIMVELKDGAMFGLPTQPVKFDRAELDAVDAEILSVFDRSEVLTPDRVRGPSATIPEAIRARGWPEVDAVRGLVLFAMDNEGAIRNRYIEGHPALKDRVMFVTADGTQAPEAAWFKVNDPIKDFDRIQRLVRDGFLVRTRADTDTRQSRANDGAQRDKALASGAQFVSTDYPEPDRRFSGLPRRLTGRRRGAAQSGQWGQGVGKQRPGETPGSIALEHFTIALPMGEPPHPPFGHLLPVGEKGTVVAFAERQALSGGGRRSPSPRAAGRGVG